MPTSSNTVTKATNSVVDSLKSAGRTASDKYKDITHGGTGGGTITGNSGFSSDAKDLARTVERMKDNALSDLDRRYG